MNVDPTLLERTNRSMIAYWGGYGQAPGRTFDQTPDDWLLWSGVPHPVMNMVCIHRYDSRRLDELVARTAVLVKEHGIGINWWLPPQSVVDEAQDRLGQAGIIAGGKVPAMLRDLSDFTEPPEPEGLRIELVEAPEARATWAEIAGRGFEFNDDQISALVAGECAIPETWLEDHQRYLGYIGDRPVAVSSLVMAADVAGVYAVATLEDARQRGLGAAMTAHAMAQGRALGAREAVLQSSDMGRSVYERLGFSTVFDYTIFVQQ